MNNKSLWKISVATSLEAEEAVAELLHDIFNLPPSSYTNVESGQTTVTVYFEQKPEWPRLRAPLKVGMAWIKSCGLKIGSGELLLDKVRREDWAESWKRHFKPIQIGRTLLVKASWHNRRPKLGQAVVVLDPGLSFGTGQHPTTHFCLEQIAKRSSKKTKLSLLDIGTGSGILAIAAAKLGFSPIKAFDFDPEAVRVARANAKRNRVLDAIDIRQADLTMLTKRNPEKFSVVCANLISNLLIAERARIIATLKPDGILVLAGILDSEFFQVQRAFEKSSLTLIASAVQNEWRSGTFTLTKKSLNDCSAGWSEF